MFFPPLPSTRAINRFLWVVFQIQDICEQSCDEDIRRVITMLPKGLRETYERILLPHQSARQGQRGANRSFAGRQTVRRPLSLGELHEGCLGTAGARRASGVSGS